MVKIVEIELTDRILTLKKNDYVRAMKNIPTNWNITIPTNALLRIDMIDRVEDMYIIEVTMLEPDEVELEFSKSNPNDTPLFIGFVENIKKVKR